MLITTLAKSSPTANQGPDGGRSGSDREEVSVSRHQPTAPLTTAPPTCSSWSRGRRHSLRIPVCDVVAAGKSSHGVTFSAGRAAHTSGMEASSALDAAHIAAEAVRRLNHLTLTPPAARPPTATLSARAAPSSVSCGCSPGACPRRSASSPTCSSTTEHDVPLGVDNDDDPAVLLADIITVLHAARVDAATLGRDLAAAHDAAAHLVVAPCLAAADHDAAQ